MLALLSLAFAADSAPDLHTFTLDNGLNVVLHRDTSDPIIALATVVHVGSSREEVGRTGFAHFFEHMAFNDSENVPRGANRKRIEELGGSRNGGTWQDGTIYYEVVPKDALEKLLWIDSDRLGFMINTVTEGALANEKEVVKNEKRQRVDNAPYGFRGEVTAKALYPPDHPYSWPVIGSLADLQAATLDDVRGFYARYYGPSNATLVLVGDLEIEPTKKLIEDYFGEIAPAEPVADLPPMPVQLDETVRLFHEDGFAKLPDLRYTFPTVPAYHADSVPLAVLGELLAFNKEAPLQLALIEGKQRAVSVYAFQNDAELAGTFILGVRAKDGVLLDDVDADVQSALDSFRVDEAALARIKLRLEREQFADREAVLDKAFQFSRFAEYAGDPAYGTTVLEAYRTVSSDDVMRAFEQYVHNQNAVITSFVPEGAAEQVLSGSTRAEVTVEAVEKGAEAPPAVVEDGEYERTPTRLDRSSEPAFGPAIAIEPLPIWSADAAGLPVTGISSSEVPLVRFSLQFRGGHRLTSPDQAGLAQLTADLLLEGTRERSAADLEAAIGDLGAELDVWAGSDAIVVQGTCLSSSFDALVAVVEEVVTEPSFEAEAFARLQAQQVNNVKARAGRATAIAASVFDKLAYGAEHPYGWPRAGTVASVERLTLKDVQRFHKTLSKRVASFQVVGDVTEADAVAAASRLSEGLSKKKVRPFEATLSPLPTDRTLYFVDLPGAKQSSLYVGRRVEESGDARNDQVIANHRLGGGASARLFQTLRIEKGFTYGAYSGIRDNLDAAVFRARSNVRANVTRESLDVLVGLIDSYADTFEPADLDISRAALVKSDLVSFEKGSAKLSHLRELSLMNLPLDHLARQQSRARSSDHATIQASARGLFDTSAMTFVVVGDAATQLAELEGFADRLIRLDADGNVLSQ